MHALIVDPDRIHQQLFFDLLTQRGWDVSLTSNAAEAMGILSGEFSPTLMISELVLPDMDGLDLVGFLRNQNGGKRTAVVICSFLNGEDDIRRSRTLQVAAFWSKPFEARRYQESLSSLVERSETVVEDVELVLRRLQISQSTYIQLLRILIEEASSLHLRLAALHQDPQGVRSLLISLRGACSSLGVVNLQKLLTRLDQQFEEDAQPDFRRTLVELPREVQTLENFARNALASWK